MYLVPRFHLISLVSIRSLMFAGLLCNACGTASEEPDGGSGLEEDLIQPTLPSLQEHLFSPRCSNASCHGGNSPVRGLDLSEGKTRESVLNVDSTISGWKYVVPNDVDSSLLYQIMIQSMSEENLRQMPPGLTVEEEVHEALRQWIQNGAEN
jgi:hypothetical protein